MPVSSHATHELEPEPSQQMEKHFRKMMKPFTTYVLDFKVDFESETKGLNAEVLEGLVSTSKWPRNEAKFLASPRPRPRINNFLHLDLGLVLARRPRPRSRSS